MTLLYLALGVIAGVLAGLFGIGGGVIMVIGLVGVMKLPFPTATGTSLGAMLLPVGLFGAIEYYRRGHVDLRAAILLAIGLTLGAWVGARIATETAPPLLQRLFAVFLLLMAVRIWTTA
ncbi:MAG TPA: sulfite exporter TauE/SafE family protein [Gemmatimonadales bacterium]|nr:sulfite exporter TauE/SafE family protein [Gemmatimonadales bacterium]